MRTLELITRRGLTGTRGHTEMLRLELTFFKSNPLTCFKFYDETERNDGTQDESMLANVAWITAVSLQGELT